MYCIVDVETTRMRGGETISIAAIIMDDKLNIIETFNQKARPQSKFYWDEDSVKIHGITWQDAQRFQRPKRCVINFMKFLRPYLNRFPLWFVYHALFGFDYVQLENMFRSHDLQFSFWKAFSDFKKISTVTMARKLLPDLQNHKLPTLCNYFNIELDHHDAFSDAMACAKIFRHLKLMEANDDGFFNLRKNLLQESHFLPAT